jgi:hypothetical protein
MIIPQLKLIIPVIIIVKGPPILSAIAPAARRRVAIHRPGVPVHDARRAVPHRQPADRHHAGAGLPGDGKRDLHVRRRVRDPGADRGGTGHSPGRVRGGLCERKVPSSSRWHG